MNSKKLLKPALLCTIAILTTSCNKKGPAEIKDNGLPQASKSTTANIAYVDIDSLQSQYNFCKDNTLLFTKKSETYKAQLNAKSQNLQRLAGEFQQKMQANAYTEAQARAQQTKLQQMQAELQQMQENLAQKFDKEQQTYNNQLRDSINKFLKEYNSTHNYSMIISKAGDNILYANPKLNITKDVIEGLNKRYTKKK